MTRSQSWRELREHVHQEPLEMPRRSEGAGAIVWLAFLMLAAACVGMVWFGTKG